MPDKKRKTLQIKRPDPNSVKAKKKPLPQVQMDQKAATSSVDTDELASLGPKTARLSRPEESSMDGNKGKTTRIALPDEEKIRKARRANATQDLGAEDSLPSAEQIAHAQKNATMPILIDTENVEESSTRNLNDTDSNESMDRTMEIDADALSTGNIESELQDVDSSEDENDQTMEIDQDALEQAASQETQALEGVDDDPRDQTMQIDPEALATGNVDPVKDESIMSMETMQMDGIDEVLQDEEEAPAADSDSDSDLTLEEMKETFNAQTMEMDPSTLADELAKKNTAELAAAESKEDRTQTMDLSESRPKTIMIKRPSKKPPASSTPTVKAVRPDAVTVRTSRPVTANTAQPKQDTSRIDVPGDSTPDGKQGKTIKLRRPSGAPATRSKASVSRMAGNAGLSVNEDGTVTSVPQAEEQLGSGWLAVAVITFLISAGAVWSLYAQINPQLPMPGRLVDMNNQIVAQSTL